MGALGCLFRHSLFSLLGERQEILYRSRIRQNAG